MSRVRQGFVRLAAGVPALVALVAMPALAQQAKPGQAWIAGGPAIGAVKLSCDNCTRPRDLGWQVSAAVGVVASRSLRPGLEASYWWGGDEDVSVQVISVSPVLYWQPSPQSPLVLRGALGIASFQAQDDPDDDTPLRTRPIAIQLGAGYRVPLSRTLALVPYGNLQVSANDDLIEGTTVVTSANVNGFAAGVMLQWR